MPRLDPTLGYRRALSCSWRLHLLGNVWPLGTLIWNGYSLLSCHMCGSWQGVPAATKLLRLHRLAAMPGTSQARVLPT